MTMEPWHSDSFLVRFEHIMDKNDDPEMSKPVTFNLAQVFPGDFEFTEVTLGANQNIEDLSRLQFKTEGAPAVDVAALQQKQAERAQALADLTVTMNPMEIRTFIMSSSVKLTTTSTTTATTSATTQDRAATAETTTAFGIRSQTVSQMFPFVVLAMIVKQFL